MGARDEWITRLYYAFQVGAERRSRCWGVAVAVVVAGLYELAGRTQMCLGLLG